MKYFLSIAFLFLLISCGDNKASSPLVKATEKEVVIEKPAAIVIPVVKYGVEGFYTGAFMATKYDGDKEIFDNKITVCIDSLNATNVFGHSVVAGNDRPFTGSYKKSDTSFSFTAHEPGDNKYDGVFSFAINPKHKLLKGTWTANDKKLAVTNREYVLEEKTYTYDPSLSLTDDIVSVPIYGTFKKDERAEAVTKDVLKKNASATMLKSKDVENMYQADLEVLRNSVYARHGYSFKNLRMRLLFDNYVSWYMPLSTDVTNLLTEIEKKNIDLIKRYEKHATRYYDSFGR